MIKEIFMWLFIFIVGSLIVSFILYPEPTASAIKERMEPAQEFISELVISNTNTNSKDNKLITNFESYTKNPKEFYENHFDKVITIKGKFATCMRGDFLKDKNDYRFYFEQRYTRSFESGKTYKITGTMKGKRINDFEGSYMFYYLEESP